MAILEPVIVKLEANSETETILKCPQDYIIDYSNGEIILKQDLNDDERLVARNYSTDIDVYNFLMTLRRNVGDLKRDDRTYSNEELLLAAKEVIPDVNSIYDWSICIDLNGAIRSMITNNIIIGKPLNVISKFAAVVVIDSNLQEALRGAISIKEGDTTIDTTKQLATMIKNLEMKKKTLLSQIENDAFEDVINTSSLAIGDARTDLPLLYHSYNRGY